MDFRAEVDKKWNWCTNCQDKTYNTDVDFCWGCGLNSSFSGGTEIEGSAGSGMSAAPLWNTKPYWMPKWFWKGYCGTYKEMTGKEVVKSN